MNSADSEVKKDILERYQDEVRELSDVNFTNLKNIAASLTRQLNEEKQAKDVLYEQLDRGVAILDYGPLLLYYLKAYGNKHNSKLLFAFRQFDKNQDNQIKDIVQGEYSIIDWGCGQGLGTACFFDYLNEQNAFKAPKRCVLVEPSELCLENAQVHIDAYAEKFNIGPIETVLVNKKLNDVKRRDIATQSDVTVHLLSNILDIEDFSLSHLAKLIKSSSKGVHYLFCLSPDYARDDSGEGGSHNSMRVNEFARYLGSSEESKTYCLTLDETGKETENVKGVFVSLCLSIIKLDTRDEESEYDHVGKVSCDDSSRETAYLLTAKRMQDGTTLSLGATFVTDEDELQCLKKGEFAEEFTEEGLIKAIDRDIPSRGSQLDEERFTWQDNLELFDVVEFFPRVEMLAVFGRRDEKIMVAKPKVLKDGETLDSRVLFNSKTPAVLAAQMYRQSLRYCSVDTLSNIPAYIDSVGILYGLFQTEEECDERFGNERILAWPAHMDLYIGDPNERWNNDAHKPEDFLYARYRTDLHLFTLPFIMYCLREFGEEGDEVNILFKEKRSK